ncbi:hypothetical protein Ah1_00320 [Aeromonas phage Ah1]|uniref:DUF7415 domain-containing protein n=1 Tax=Aeromonas phage Ah1 TaxID=2053701 RepID=A0A2H4YF82_9CAUD|nr:hypothetical protein KNT77_gp198 [Aeromonas phage Ah1]AUE22838.1 hypothetical protein Ah1_00320 [Aeromonas phage Ah1]
MKKIDWNDMSSLGLIKRINEQVLHPLGLAMTRNPETGSSDYVLIAPDGVFQYDETIKGRSTLTDEQIKQRANELGSF